MNRLDNPFSNLMQSIRPSLAKKTKPNLVVILQQENNYVENVQYLTRNQQTEETGAELFQVVESITV